jgi:flagellar motor switch protein FliM
VTSIDFVIDSYETDPQVLQILSPNEAVVAISMEIRVGESSGMMNIGVPSMVIKALRDKFSQQWMMRRSEPSSQDQTRIFNLIRSAHVQAETKLIGPEIRMKDLVDLKEGDVLMLDFPTGKPLSLLLNGRPKYAGQVVVTGRKRGFQIERIANENVRPEANAG